MHYKKLTRGLVAHQQALDAFQMSSGSPYDDLLAYREQPTDAERVWLVAAFDSLVATTTDYWALNERIAKTRARKTVLLAVLEHPEILRCTITRRNWRPVSGCANGMSALGCARSTAPRAWDTFCAVAGGYHAQIGDRLLSLHP